MKIRNGFVSNSSTSSFVCLICNCVGAGRDASIYDFDMVECINGHHICQKHTLPDIELGSREYKVRLKKYFEKNTYMQNLWKENYELLMSDLLRDEEVQLFYTDVFNEDRGKIHEDQCPICSLKVLPDYDWKEYLINRIRILTEEELLVEIREKYGNYKSFSENIKCEKRKNAFPEII